MSGKITSPMSCTRVKWCNGLDSRTLWLLERREKVFCFLFAFANDFSLFPTVSRVHWVVICEGGKCNYITSDLAALVMSFTFFPSRSLGKCFMKISEQMQRRRRSKEKSPIETLLVLINVPNEEFSPWDPTQADNHSQNRLPFRCSLHRKHFPQMSVQVLRRESIKHSPAFDARHQKKELKRKVLLRANSARRQDISLLC